MEKRKRKNNYIRTTLLSFLLIIFALTIFGIGYMEMKEWEDSVLSIFAEQQDSYVQLAVKQIQKDGNRSDEEIVTQLLDSLSSSNQTYWTLSKQQSLLYVRDDSETNRYRGFTTSTYFSSNSAKQFLGSLRQNEVVHANIVLDKECFVVSGVLFQYSGAEYKLCLLTRQTAILEQNEFLSSKIGLLILLVVLLCFILVVTMVFVIQNETQQSTINTLSERLESKNQIIEKQEKTIQSYDFYHTRYSLFHRAMLEGFLVKLDQRKIKPIVLMQVEFEEENDYFQFLQKAQLLLDKKVLRFEQGKKSLLLLFIQYTQQEAEKAFAPFLDLKVKYRFLSMDKSIEKMYEGFWDKESEGGIKDDE